MIPDPLNFLIRVGAAVVDAYHAATMIAAEAALSAAADLADHLPGDNAEQRLGALGLACVGALTLTTAIAVLAVASPLEPDMLADPLAEVLMHALGLDERRRAPWRNYYVTGAHRADRVAQLVALGFMEPTRRPGFLHADDRTFRVTAAGQVEALAANDRINPPPKRSAARYRAWLDSAAADCGISFGDFLKRKLYQRVNA